MPAVKPKHAAHAQALARLAAAEERVDLQAAELVAARADLAAVLRIVRGIGGYMRPEHQHAVWAAEARLAAGTVKR